MHAPRCPVAMCRALCRGAVEKKTVLENLDLILLAMDETVDGGCAPPHPFCYALGSARMLLARREQWPWMEHEQPPPAVVLDQSRQLQQVLQACIYPKL